MYNIIYVTEPDPWMVQWKYERWATDQTKTRSLINLYLNPFPCTRSCIILATVLNSQRVHRESSYRTAFEPTPPAAWRVAARKIPSRPCCRANRRSTRGKRTRQPRSVQQTRETFSRLFSIPFGSSRTGAAAASRARRVHLYTGQPRRSVPYRFHRGKLMTADEIINNIY